MAITDPIGDLLARIRNGLMVNKETVRSPASKMRERVLEVLKSEGFIRGYSRHNVRKGIDELEIELKYFEGKPVIKHMQRTSKPSRRIYTAIDELKPVYNGLGVAVLSTSRGVMSDRQARQDNIGGEVLCEVF